MGVLGMEPGSSERAACSLNGSQATYPDPTLRLLCHIILHVTITE